MKIIEKKILPECFQAVFERRKNFELRKDDDNIQVGDILYLNEWTGVYYTGCCSIRTVGYVLRDCSQFGLMPGYCIVGW